MCMGVSVGGGGMCVRTHTHMFPQSTCKMPNGGLCTYSSPNHSTERSCEKSCSHLPKNLPMARECVREDHPDKSMIVSQYYWDGVRVCFSKSMAAGKSVERRFRGKGKD